jgi:hypothetical protein
MNMVRLSASRCHDYSQDPKGIEHTATHSKLRERFGVQESDQMVNGRFTGIPKHLETFTGLVKCRAESYEIVDGAYIPSGWQQWVC